MTLFRRLQAILKEHDCEFRLSCEIITWTARLSWEGADVEGRGDTMEEAIEVCLDNYPY